MHYDSNTNQSLALILPYRPIWNFKPVYLLLRTRDEKQFSMLQRVLGPGMNVYIFYFSIFSYLGIIFCYLMYIFICGLLNLLNPLSCNDNRFCYMQINTIYVYI
jgi:hypothetical protein